MSANAPAAIVLVLAGCTGSTSAEPEPDGDPTDSDTDIVVEEEACDGSPDCALCDDLGFWVPLRDATDVIEAVGTLTEAQHCSDYSGTTDWMFTVLDNVDGFVTCVYTGRTLAVGDEKPDPNDMNTEHTWPQSLGAEYEPQKCDLHHLFVSDADANSKRGNSPFGEVVSGIEWEEGGSRLGRDSNGATVFEPRDDHKGNAARALLYFWARYADRVSEESVDSLVDVPLFRAWHASDPPDEAEIERSLSIAERQGSANPFVVCPTLVDRLEE